ncbi:MAG: ammonium transporter [Eubacteriales bacterium]
MKTVKLALALTLLLVLVLPGMAWAADAPKIDTGDTTFVMIASALVMLMTPGLALFYGGMVRRKNVLSTFMQSFILIAIISVQWVLIGYTLAFGPDKGHLIGSLSWLGFNGVGMTPNADYAATVPHQIFAMFQLMFAIITPALITGSIAERMRFPAFLAFMVLWATFIYDPLAHWVWGVNGWIRNLGALDFAGGTVVHISSGVSGLVAAIVLGKRKGYGKDPLLPHQLPMTVLGAGLLWFGWFGFNAGSALAANGLATNAFVVTNTSAAAAALSWLTAEWLHHGKPTALGAASGAVAGLVAITPASGYVTPMSALAIGLVGGVVCYLGVSVLKSKLGYDDALDAFGCHGIGGTWGAIATGLFATKAINPAGADGLFYGNPGLMKAQLISIVATYALAIVGTFVILKVVNAFTPIRATADEEMTGLDLTMHGEEAYRDLVMSASHSKSGYREKVAETPSVSVNAP